VPSGMVSVWDTTNLLAQLPLGGNGSCAVTNQYQSGGSHAITASYASDTLFASSSGGLLASPGVVTGVMMPDLSLSILFTNTIGLSFTVLGTPDPSLAFSNWAALGSASEVSPGSFQFADVTALSRAQRFYRVRSP